MLKKTDLDNLITLTRKWYNEKDKDLANTYYEQAISLSRAIAKGTRLAHEEVGANQLFRYAWHIAEKRSPNEQLYIMVERAGEQVDHWDYQGHFT